MKFNPYIKRITIVISFVLFSVIIYSLTLKDSVSKENVVEVNATPITNKVIVLDAGHRASR